MVTVPVALTERVAEALDPVTVLNAVPTIEEAHEAWQQSFDCQECFVHSMSAKHGGFAWEVIAASQRVNKEGHPMTNAEFQTLRDNAIAVVRGEQGMEDVAGYIQSLNQYSNIAHAEVAFLVMAAKHLLNNDVAIRRYHNTRYRGRVIRPAVDNLLASIEAKRHGATHPAVAIVTDKNDMTHFMAFENCWEANFEGIASWRGQTFNTVGYYDEVNEFVDAIQAVVDAFNSKDYSFLEDSRD